MATRAFSIRSLVMLSRMERMEATPRSFSPVVIITRSYRRFISRAMAIWEADSTGSISSTIKAARSISWLMGLLQ
ncbi:hypothetical protein D3C71_1959740 [compost metagenome]